MRYLEEELAARFEASTVSQDLRTFFLELDQVFRCHAVNLDDEVFVRSCHFFSKLALKLPVVSAVIPSYVVDFIGI